MSPEQIAAALGKPRREGHGWKCLCPSHDDSDPSLSIEEKQGKLLVNCRAGCEQTAIVDALKQRDLWPKTNGKTEFRRDQASGEKRPIIPVPTDAPPVRFKHPKYGEPSRLWPYRLASGELAGHVARFDYTENGEKKKSFLPLTFCDMGNGRRGWRAKGFPEPRPLYRLLELLQEPDAPVIVTEGEKACDAARRLFPN